jgi:hypothetical protein
MEFHDKANRPARKRETAAARIEVLRAFAVVATPPASPDVEGLVKALEASDEYLSDNRLNEIGSGSILHRQMQDALSTWRQAQTTSTLPASSAEE